MNARAKPDLPVLDDAAFDRLVHAQRASLERFTRGLGASWEDAEEVAATALLRAYQSPPGRLDLDWRPWLRTVARNLWIDTRRRRTIRVVPDEGALERLPSTGQTVDQIAATADEAREICAAIALLPAPQRAAIYLREVRGLSYDEIALELGISLAAVTSTLHRARQSLSQGRGPLRSALGLVFAPFFLLRRAAGAARLAGASSLAAKAALPIAFVATVGGATVIVHESRAVVPHATARTAPRLASSVSGGSQGTARVSLSTATGRAGARVPTPDRSAHVLWARQASSALSSARPSVSPFFPSSTAPPTTSSSNAATPAPASTVPPASAPATSTQTPSASPRVDTPAPPVDEKPADVIQPKAPSATPGRSTSAHGRSTSPNAHSSAGNAASRTTGNERRAAGHANANANAGAGTTHNGSDTAARARSASRATSSAPAGSSAHPGGSSPALTAAGNGTNTAATSARPSSTASAHAAPGSSAKQAGATTGTASAPASAPARGGSAPPHAVASTGTPDAGPPTATVPVAAPTGATPADAGPAASSQGQGAVADPPGDAGTPAKGGDVTATDAPPSGQGHAKDPPSGHTTGVS